jgi:hypothetical protein
LAIWHWQRVEEDNSVRKASEEDLLELAHLRRHQVPYQACNNNSKEEDLWELTARGSNLPEEPQEDLFILPELKRSMAFARS